MYNRSNNLVSKLARSRQQVNDWSVGQFYNFSNATTYVANISITFNDYFSYGNYPIVKWHATDGSVPIIEPRVANISSPIGGDSLDGSWIFWGFSHGSDPSDIYVLITTTTVGPSQNIVTNQINMMLYCSSPGFVTIQPSWVSAKKPTSTTITYSQL